MLADLPAAVSALTELFVSEWGPWYGPNGEGNAESDLKACMNRDRLPFAFVALNDDGDVLGVAALKTDSLGNERGYSPWLSSLVVVPAYRNQGIGSALIKAIEEHSRALGFQTIYAATDKAHSILMKRRWQSLNEEIQSLRGPVSLYELKLS